jgi:hypothetical protein
MDPLFLAIVVAFLLGCVSYFLVVRRCIRWVRATPFRTMVVFGLESTFYVVVMTINFAWWEPLFFLFFAWATYSYYLDWQAELSSATMRHHE